MAVKRPLVLDPTTGAPKELTTPDTLDPAILPVTSSAFNVDGGSATSTFAGTLKIDYGGAT